MGIFRKETKLNPRNIYTLRKTIELAADQNYNDYEFIPVDENDIQRGYRAILKNNLECNTKLYNNYQNAKRYRNK